MAERGSDAERWIAKGEADITVTSLRTDDRLPGGLRRGRFWYRVIGAALLAALALAGTVLWLHPSLPGSAIASHPARIADPLTMDANSAHIPCVDGGAWSPDSRSFVLAGNARCITGGLQYDETVAVFDARTGAERAHALIQWIVMQRVLPPPGRGTWSGAEVGFGQPLWAPDSRRIVVPFETGIPGALATAGGPTNARDGIVMLDSGLNAMQILPGLDHRTVQLGGGNFGPKTVERWDLSTGTASAMTLPMGLVYAWSPDGTLTSPGIPPQSTEATVQKGAAGPIGNPMGGISFTMWQRGTVHFADGSGCEQPASNPAPDYYMAFLYTSAWSPDSRYLMLELSANGELPIAPPAPPTPGPLGASGCTNFGGASQWPQLPVRDAGMGAALGLIEGNIQSSIELTWSPDGRRVAVEPGDVSNGAPALVIYDCAGGRELKRWSRIDIVPTQASGEPFSAMAWSPDGTRLLLMEFGGDPIIHVLGPKSLSG